MKQVEIHPSGQAWRETNPPIDPDHWMDVVTEAAEALMKIHPDTEFSPDQPCDIEGWRWVPELEISHPVKVIITGTRSSQSTGGYMTAEMDDPRHPSREFVRQAKTNLGAHRISISVDNGGQQPPVWQG
jgi:hypothetical protein